MDMRKTTTVLLVLATALGAVIAAPAASAGGDCNGVIDDHCKYNDTATGTPDQECRTWVAICVIG